MFDALKTLYQKTDLKELAKESSILVNENRFAAQLEESIQKRKEAFRERMKIESDDIVVFVSLGNNINESEFSIDACRRGVKEFQLKYGAPTSLSLKALPHNKFWTVISLQKNGTQINYLYIF